ncbi:hypothetical protein GTY65_17640 [Streptomyces sp. SID8379]|uniref:hypothetical protein n=1 Tax=unclassified Streptomyces TaxID=2593676 RepID=UPI00035D85CE|nr:MULTISPECIES: hypothetical protein [unclassified Streptomyces]MYW65864.1 hypothetical protein [Streptomyces sp. SID8379]
MNLDSTAVAPAALATQPQDLILIDELDQWTVPASAQQAQTWICLREDRSA